MPSPLPELPETSHDNDSASPAMGRGQVVTRVRKCNLATQNAILVPSGPSQNIMVTISPNTLFQVPPSCTEATSMAPQLQWGKVARCRVR